MIAVDFVKTHLPSMGKRDPGCFSWGFQEEIFLSCGGTMWAPDPVKSGVTTPVRRFFFTPVAHFYKAIYRGYYST